MVENTLIKMFIISSRHNATTRPVHWRILQEGTGYYSSEMLVEKSREKSA